MMVERMPPTNGPSPKILEFRGSLPDPGTALNRPNGVANDPSRFRPKLISEFPHPTLPKLIRGLVHEQDLMLVYGASSSGKSFATVDLSLRMAHGQAWQGYPTQQVAIVYIAGEAAGSIQRRGLAWMLHHGHLGRGGDPPWGVIGSPPNLLSGDDLEAVIGEITGSFLPRVGLPLGLVVVDTMHSCTHGSKEDTEDAGRVLGNIREIQRRLNTAVLMVHHTGKDSKAGPRGSSTIEANVDLSAEVVEDTDDRRLIILRKTRDGKLPELQPFRIETVQLARAEDGTPIESAVAVPTMQSEATPDAADPRRDKVFAMRKDGDSIRKIANALGLTKSTVDRWLKGPSP
jgi:hypothetical protein